MMVYYFDDSGDIGDHWKDLGELPDDDAAIEKAVILKNRYKVFPCIVYDENYRTVKEWRTKDE